MRDKILVWLDETLTHFGIIKELQERENIEIYAIVNTNKGRKFYETQKIVNFTKVWYFRDCFKNLKDKPDMKYLENFEREYNINLWKIAYSDELIYEYNKYTKFSENEILRILESDCKFFEKVLNEISPTFLFMKISDTCDMQILHQLCIAKNIKPLILGPTRLGNKYIISEDFDKLDKYENSNIKKIENNFKTFKQLKNYLNDYSELQTEFLKKFQKSKIRWVKAGIKFLELSLNKEYKNFYRNKSRTIWNVSLYSISFIIKKFWRRRFIEKYLQTNLNTEKPFIYFPLQLEPERTIQIPAPYYTNQIDVINKIVKSLPVQFTLYVKEHPAQSISGWRTRSFYKEILEMPNVELFHPYIKNEIMIKNCSMVITITGTSALEAVTNEKPVITLANTNFSLISSVCKLKNLEELSTTIIRMLKIKPKLDDFTKYLKIIESESFEFSSREMSMKICNYFYYDGFLFDTEIPLSKINLFLKENKIIFKKLVNEHVKKMNKFKKI
jgi:hypothetical protein